jgi:CRP-like cAMP-binding protein
MEQISPDELEKLSTTPLFSGLTLPELETIRESAIIKKASAEEFYFYQGDPAENIYILRSGRVKITQINAEGQQVLMRVIGPWNMFAVIALMETGEYPASAQSVDHSQAFLWSRLDLIRMVEKIPRLSLNILQIMTSHVKEFQNRYVELATERVERRLARALLRLANQTGKKTEQGVLIDFPLSRQDLAEMTDRKSVV